MFSNDRQCIAMVCRADMRQYVGPPTVAAIAQMLKGGVEVNTNRLMPQKL